ncbi:MAG: DUF4347 domain-containing protein, partial [Rhodospirillaceae bacterium]
MTASATRRNDHRVRQRLMFTALEPRMMFDGAAVAVATTATADATHHTDTTPAPDPIAQAIANHVLPVDPTAAVSVPIQVRAADPSQDGGKKEVVFVDTNIADYQTLVNGVRAGVEIDLIDGGQSGLAQMARWAESHSEYNAILIISHGAEATLYLGTDTMTEVSLSDNTVQVELAEIGHSLKSGGDLLLYGCDVARGLDGRQLVTGIATSTGAAVAASTDATGAAARGGNWTLEYTSSNIETPSLYCGDYSRVLANVFAHLPPHSDSSWAAG